MRLFVGGIPYATTEDELQALFSAEGQVASVSIVTDRFTGQSRGFGFVDMPNEAEAQQAIRTLNGRVFGGRSIAVNEAKAQAPRGGGGDRGGYRGGGGGDRGGYGGGDRGDRGGYGGGGGGRRY